MRGKEDGMERTFTWALVTGAGGGIGRAISQKLDADGCRLILVGRRLSTLEATASGLHNQPILIEADLTDPMQCEACAEILRKQMNSVSFLCSI